jgi:hypothetical protein
MSAALPGQGGTHHVNERWTDYLTDMFARFGYQPFDFVRPLFWDDDRIDPWYRQNVVGLFRGPPPDALVAAAESATLARLRNPGRLVHPEIFALAGRSDPCDVPRRLANRMIHPAAAALSDAVAARDEGQSSGCALTRPEFRCRKSVPGANRFLRPAHGRRPGRR